MKQFAEWVTGRDYRAGIFAGALALIPLLGILGSGLLVLTALKRGGWAGWGATAVAALVLLVAGRLGGSPAMAGLIAALVLWAPAVALAGLLRRAGSLSLCVQVAIVGGLLLAGLLGASLGQGDAGWTARLLEGLRPFIADSGAGDEVMQVMIGILPGAVAGSVMIAALLALFIGMSLHASLVSPGAFGKAFRSLRVGRVLAGLAVVMMVALLFTGQLVFGSLLAVMTAGLSLQGLASIHDMAARRRWPPGIIGVVYVLLIFMMGITGPLLASLGVVDNWIEIRGRGQPGS
jgi:hypothetical protein